jgi:short-subunit dehydrogenase
LYSSPFESRSESNHGWQITGQSGVDHWCERRDRSTAQALAREGAHLVLTARREDRLREMLREVEKLGGQAAYVAGDAREEQTARRCAEEEAMKKFGRIDILVNNAGVGNYKTLVDTSAEEYDEMMDANVRSTFLFSRHVVPVMIEQQSGLVLMVSSMAGVYGFAGEATYCATKFAQVGFAQGLDQELRPYGIKVGTICPGGVETEFAIGKGVPKLALSNHKCSKQKMWQRQSCSPAHSQIAPG